MKTDDEVQVLQTLVFCGPFYYFLDHLGKQVAHSFKGDTPLIDAMLVQASPSLRLVLH